MPKLTRRKLLGHFQERDVRLCELIETAGPYRLAPVAAASPFRHLAEAIIAQQISSAAARSITGRFTGLYAKSIHAKDGFPSAQQVLDTPQDSLRSAGLSAGKVRALLDLADKTLAGIVPDTATLNALDDATIIERLTAVHGIGRWTVQMMLMFQLGRSDVLPCDDYGVRRGFQLTYRKRQMPTAAELAKFGVRWSPYRSAAAWYLWRAVDLARAGKWPVTVRDGARAKPQLRVDARTPKHPRPKRRSRGPK
jgi:3-methyladenine DNA glycosylase/8-oxoguanine DNA glycosylase